MVSAIAYVVFSAVAPQPSYSFSEWYWIMQEGDRGDDVAELQSRLRLLGFYGGNVDGSFGPGTKRAVTGFQREFGMNADGRVGPQTKLKLSNATRAWNTGDLADYYRGGGGGGAPAGGGGGNAPTARATSLTPTTHGFSASELKILERTVHGEARGEPYVGQVAVAAVVLNRIDNPAFPNTISGVVFQPRAFTAVDDGQIWLEPNESAAKAVRDALNGWDPSDGALYYFNPITATSKWIWTRPQIKQIGKHIFCM
ncbi:spore cortex-lytic enzyme [Paenibacillus sp. TRM 82003]|nr:spore cortex-lytic enzyme [Paenibacillus sp. TRM 82003]